MLHTKSKGHPPSGSGEEDFKVFFNYIWGWRPSWSGEYSEYDQGGKAVMVARKDSAPKTRYSTLRHPKMHPHTKFGFLPQIM